MIPLTSGSITANLLATDPAKANVLCIGVAVQDMVFGFDQIPTEAKKYRANSLELVGGGCAANAAVAVARLGGCAYLASRLGDDEIGEAIISSLQHEGINCDQVHRFNGKRSSLSAVFVDAQGERLIANYRDTELPANAHWLQLIHAPNGKLKTGAVLADTRWPDGATQAMQLAKKAGIAGILDAEAPLADCQQAMQLASHIVFSMQGLLEYKTTTTMPHDPIAAVRQIARKFGNWTAVTNGAQGVYWADAADNFAHVPAFPVKAVDTLGAGDTWHGAFALALAESVAESPAILFANAAAALKCTQFGGRAGIPDRQAVNDLINSISQT